MIALGTRVKFTEVAYVVRKPTTTSKWMTLPRGNFSIAATARSSWPDKPEPGTARLLAPVREGTNKNVIALPREGSGVVVGLERKLVGRSYAGGGQMTSMSGETEYEQGWFESRGHVDLYVVRSSLRGPSFYVPAESLSVLS